MAHRGIQAYTTYQSCFDSFGKKVEKEHLPFHPATLAIEEIDKENNRACPLISKNINYITLSGFVSNDQGVAMIAVQISENKT